MRTIYNTLVLLLLTNICFATPPTGTDTTVTLTATDSVYFMKSLLSTDIDGDSVIFTIQTSAVNGTGAIDAQGNLYYTANPGFTLGCDSIRYTVCDDAGVPECNTDTFSIVIQRQGDSFVAVDDSATIYSGTEVELDLTVNDTTTGFSSITVSAITSPTNGNAIAATDSTILISTVAGLSSTETFDYEICSEVCASTGFTVCDTGTVVYNVVISDITIYQGISPATADGYNDEWIIEGIESYPNNEVVIMNRWGNKVFDASGYDNNNVVWKGLNDSGNELPDGAYFYIVKLNNDDDTVFTGYVQLNN